MGTKLCYCNDDQPNKYETSILSQKDKQSHLSQVTNIEKYKSKNTSSSLVEKINSLPPKERYTIINKINKITFAYRNHLNLKTVIKKIIKN